MYTLLTGKTIQSSGLVTVKRLENIQNKYSCGRECDKLDACIVGSYENRICYLMSGYLDVNDPTAITQGDSDIFIKKIGKKYIYLNLIF